MVTIQAEGFIYVGSLRTRDGWIKPPETHVLDECVEYAKHKIKTQRLDEIVREWVGVKVRPMHQGVTFFAVFVYVAQKLMGLKQFEMPPQQVTICACTVTTLFVEGALYCVQPDYAGLIVPSTYRRTKFDPESLRTECIKKYKDVCDRERLNMDTFVRLYIKMHEEHRFKCETVCGMAEPRQYFRLVEECNEDATVVYRQGEPLECDESQIDKAYFEYLTNTAKLLHVGMVVESYDFESGMLATFVLREIQIFPDLQFFGIPYANQYDPAAERKQLFFPKPYQIRIERILENDKWGTPYPGHDSITSAKTAKLVIPPTPRVAPFWLEAWSNSLKFPIQYWEAKVHPDFLNANDYMQVTHGQTLFIFCYSCKCGYRVDKLFPRPKEFTMFANTIDKKWKKFFEALEMKTPLQQVQGFTVPLQDLRDKFYLSGQKWLNLDVLKTTYLSTRGVYFNANGRLTRFLVKRQSKSGPTTRKSDERLKDLSFFVEYADSRWASFKEQIVYPHFGGRDVVLSDAKKLGLNDGNRLVRVYLETDFDQHQRNRMGLALQKGFVHHWVENKHHGDGFRTIFVGEHAYVESNGEQRCLKVLHQLHGNITTYGFSQWRMHHPFITAAGWSEPYEIVHDPKGKKDECQADIAFPQLKERIGFCNGYGTAQRHANYFPKGDDLFWRTKPTPEVLGSTNLMCLYATDVFCFQANAENSNKQKALEKLRDSDTSWLEELAKVKKLIASGMSIEDGEAEYATSLDTSIGADKVKIDGFNETFWGIVEDSVKQMSMAQCLGWAANHDDKDINAELIQDGYALHVVTQRTKDVKANNPGAVPGSDVKINYGKYHAFSRSLEGQASSKQFKFARAFVDVSAISAAAAPRRP